MTFTQVDSAVFVLDGLTPAPESAATARRLLPADTRWTVVAIVPEHPLITSGATGFASPILTPEEMERQAEADRDGAEAVVAATASVLGDGAAGRLTDRGDVASAVRRVLDDEPGSLVVTASTDVAEDLTNAEVPLVLVVPGDGAAPSDGPVVVAVDDSPLDERILATVASLVGPARQIVTVHVAPTVPPGVSTTAMGVAAVAAPTDVDGTLADEAERTAATTAGSGDGERITAIGSVGDPVTRVLELSDENDASMIVLGTRNRGWLSRLLRPSVSDEVRRRTDRPVLVIH